MSSNDPPRNAPGLLSTGSRPGAFRSAPSTRARLRLRLQLLAPRLAGFDLESFGHPDDGEEDCLVPRAEAQLAAGTLFHAIDVVLGELSADAATLGRQNTSAAQCHRALYQLNRLPPQFAHRYTPFFARRLLARAVDLTDRLTRPGFQRLGCVAEELLLRLLLEQAQRFLARHLLLDDNVITAWEVLRNAVYRDMDHEWLYDPALDGIDQDPAAAHLGIAPMGVDDWFTPFGDPRY